MQLYPASGSPRSTADSYKLYLREPELRWAWREACAAFGRLAPACIAASIAGGLLGATLLPLTVLVSCFLKETWLPVVASQCMVWPGNPVAWAVVSGVLISSGPVVAWLRHVAARRQWYVRWFGVKVGPSTVAAFGVGLITGLWWRSVLRNVASAPGAVDVFTALAGPWAVWWWHAALHWAWRLEQDPIWLAQHVAWMLIWQRTHLRTPMALSVSIDQGNVFAVAKENEAGRDRPSALGGEGSRDTVEEAGTLVVRGPFDAVDALRWDDLVRRMIPGRWSARTESTLSEEEYWHPYRADLGPSGYVSPPIGISWWASRGEAILLAAAALLAVGLIATTVYLWRRGLLQGIRPEDLEDFFRHPALSGPSG